MSEFYILSLKHTRRTDLIVWWGPNRCGYTNALDRAGRYTAAEVEAGRLDDKQSTFAVPVELAERFASRTVSVDKLRDVIRADAVMTQDGVTLGVASLLGPPPFAAVDDPYAEREPEET